MLHRFLPVFFVFIVLLTGCAGIKSLTAADKKQVSVPSANNNKNEIKFLDISSPDDAKVKAREIRKETHSSGTQSIKSTETENSGSSSIEIEKASPLYLKYAQLMNTEVEQVQNIALYQTIDDWYGTRYKLGGTTKNGIDCSALVQTIFVSVFGVTLPRTARDQYKATRRISRTELKEGDLLFFNTLGGISHVGIYLQNNKFVHASLSGGVIISDMFESYYVRRFIAAGRVSGLNSHSLGSVNP